MLQFFGIGSAFNTKLGNNNAFMKHGDELFMIDCGSTTFSRMISSGILDDVKKITVLQTHLHADHVGSLGDLVGYAFYCVEPKQTAKVTILTPKDLTEDINEILKKVGITNNQYTSVEIEGEYRPESLMGITSIKPYKVTHVPHLQCYAYLMKINGQVMYYSGDSNEIPADILEKLKNGSIDLFYQDTSKADFEGNVHLSLRKLEELVPVSCRERVYCMHLDEGFSKEEAIGLGFHVVDHIMDKTM